MRARATLTAFLLLAASAYAVETKFWQQADQSDFEKGTFQNISLRSDGRMFLAPGARDVFDSSTPYLWSIACDSAGNLFTGGGGTGNGRSKLFEITRDGKSKTLAELDGLEIHAIAVDSRDQIYAATAPDGKIYKVSRDGKSQVFYDPHAKYIWAMAFNKAGELFVATGDQGEIYKVTPDGSGSVFFKTEETHARSLAIDAVGNLIVGTEPGGLILKISPSGAGFVLYQAPKREITAVAVAKDGQVYAAAVGNRTAIPPAVVTPALKPTSTSSSSGGGTLVVTASAHSTTPAPPPASVLAPAAVSGGSDVYRIHVDGSPRKVWSNSQDIVYAIGFDRDGLPLFGTGNRGRVYRLDSDVNSTLLLNLPPTQITTFCATARGDLYAATGNIGRVYEIGPGFAQSGSFESEPLDAGAFSFWGRITLHGSTKGITLETRSGNLNRPVNSWSPWAAVALQPAGDDVLSGRVSSPSARFLQYRINVTAAAATRAPEVSYLDIAYLTKNVAPVVEQIEITPPNYKFPAPSVSLTPSTSLTLPALGTRRTSSSPVIESSSPSTLTYAKGYTGARWLASDENGDKLMFKLEIRGRGEREWKLLKDKLHDRYYGWDSTAFPDGEYELRVSCSDEPSNPPAEALSSSLISDPFLIDNTPPQITGLTASAVGGRIEVRWRAHDSRSIIDHAEYSLNGGDWLVAEPVTKLSDSPEEEYHLVLQRPSTGEQTIAVRVTDAFDNQAVDKAVVR